MPAPRWRRAAWGALLCAPLLALAEPWVAPWLSDAAACRARFTAGDPLDPWGRPWCARPVGMFQQVRTYSAGPNGVDEQMVADDVLVHDVRYAWVRALPLPLAAVAWLLLATAPAAGGRRREAVRVAVLTAVPSLVAAWLLLGPHDHALLRLYDEQPGTRLLPAGPAILATAAVAFLLGALLLRAQRARAAAAPTEAAERPARAEAPRSHHRRSSRSRASFPHSTQ